MPGAEPIGTAIERVLRTYGSAERQPLASLADAFATSGLVASWPSLRVRWSAGRVPWVAFLDERATSTTQRGVHVVLAFREDMSGAYVGVAQGRRADVAARRATAASLRTRSDELEDAGFSLDANPDLRTRSALGRSCERSLIASKLYTPGAVPSDEQILADLEAALLAVDRHISGPERDGTPSLAEIAQAFRRDVDATGMAVPAGHGDRIVALIGALVTKPFVILTGLSGSGKTQLALRLGEWFGSSRMLVLPVRPDWTGPEALFGYEDALRPARRGRAAWFVPDTLAFMLAARQEPQLPYLLVLDEMNLAHVERYFSDFLSGIESRQKVVPDLVRGADGEWRVDPAGEGKVAIPRNLFVIGTVNVDETTYLFSPKVLDRAATFEVRTATTELAADRRRPEPIEDADRTELLKAFAALARDDHWQIASPPRWRDRVESALVRLHEALTETGDEFGHRGFYESMRLAAAFEQLGDGGYERALDHIVMLKLLPRVHGSRRRVEPVLRRLQAFAYRPDRRPDPASADLSRRPRLPLTADKVARMLDAVAINQFVSFTE